jgi:hypothetical protein
MIMAGRSYPEVDALRKAAEKILRLWNEFNSQEMYGEMLREGMSDPDDDQREMSHFEIWEEAHDELRNALKGQ